MKHNLLKISVLVAVSIICLRYSWPALAAELYVSPLRGNSSGGSIFQVDIRLDSQNQEVNAVESTLYYPNTLALKSILTGQSLINFWIKPPASIASAKKGLNAISFSGLSPGGLTTANGLIASFQFTVPTSSRNQQQFLVELDNSRVLLNDGRGTAADLTTKNATLTIPANLLPQTSAAPEVIDSTPPEPFTIAISRSPTLFDNKWFVAFAAHDKQSGIDHYEMQESLSGTLDASKWIAVENPAVLSDQSRQSFVFVRAVDRFGQAQVSVAEPAKKTGSWYTKVLILCIMLVVALVVRLFVLRRRRETHEIPIS